MYQEVRQEGHTFKLVVHCDPSERMITYDDVLGIVQVRAARDFFAKHRITCKETCAACKEEEVGKLSSFLSAC